MDTLQPDPDWFKTVADARLDGLFIVKGVRDQAGLLIDFECVDINGHALKLLGMDREKVIGQKLWGLLPINREDFFDKYVQVLATGAPLEEEFPIVTTEAKARWLRHQVVRVGGGIVIFARDITLRKEAEARLKESEERMRLAMTAAHMGAWTHHLKSGMFSFSEGMGAVFGLPQVEGIRTVDELIRAVNPADRDLVSRTLAVGRETGAPLRVEFRTTWPDGTLHWVEVQKYFIDDATGAVERGVGIAIDITERKRSEESLRKSSERFERMAETVPTVLYDYVLNPDGSNRFTYMNHRSKEIFGVDAEEIIADSNKFWSLVHEDDRQLVRDEDKRANKTGTGLVIEHRIVTPQGKLKWLHTESKPSSAATGEPSTWSGFILDITERKAAQEGIEHLAQHDILTGLANRALFSDRLQNALSSALRDRCSLALMSIDLDMFKPVNDQFGHPVGDLLLKEVAQRMVACVRDSDTVARIGGDEFVVLLRNVAGEHEALTVAEKIRANLEQPFVVAGHTVRISCCVGIALYPQHGEDELSLSKHADFSMYHAKGNGRNQVRLHQAH